MGKPVRYNEVRFFLEEGLLSPSFMEQAVGLSVTGVGSGKEIGRVTRIRRIRHLRRNCIEVSIDVERKITPSPNLSISIGARYDPS